MRWLLAIMLALILCGCGGQPQSPAAHFRATQEHTKTTHGRIKMESVVGKNGDKVAYETEDGKKWIVTATPDNQGGYRYSQPVPAD